MGQRRGNRGGLDNGHLLRGMKTAAGRFQIRRTCQKAQLAPNRKLSCRRPPTVCTFNYEEGEAF